MFSETRPGQSPVSSGAAPSSESLPQKQVDDSAREAAAPPSKSLHLQPQMQATGVTREATDGSQAAASKDTGSHAINVGRSAIDRDRPFWDPVRH